MGRTINHSSSTEALHASRGGFDDGSKDVEEYREENKFESSKIVGDLGQRRLVKMKRTNFSGEGFGEKRWFLT